MVYFSQCSLLYNVTARTVRARTAIGQGPPHDISACNDFMGFRKEIPIPARLGAADFRKVARVRPSTFACCFECLRILKLTYATPIPSVILAPHALSPTSQLLNVRLYR